MSEEDIAITRVFNMDTRFCDVIEQMGQDMVRQGTYRCEFALRADTGIGPVKIKFQVTMIPDANQ